MRRGPRLYKDPAVIATVLRRFGTVRRCYKPAFCRICKCVIIRMEKYIDGNSHGLWAHTHCVEKYQPACENESVLQRNNHRS